MKSKLTYLAASAAALVITTTNLQAKDEPGFYAKVDAGGSLQQDLKINGADFAFNPGFRANLGLRLQFLQGIRRRIRNRFHLELGG
ncbi:hypothetical protein [Pedosphaera parvula]|uniref:hypothetical protein n=1 Tax=Pedosphaera parvula TaxID=1032527 RepID=UPI000318D3C8|nr:hypothetical protein [Pedosphaera parvula]